MIKNQITILTEENPPKKEKKIAFFLKQRTAVMFHFVIHNNLKLFDVIMNCTKDLFALLWKKYAREQFSLNLRK